MGNRDSKAFTEHGLKNIYLSILIAIPFCILFFVTPLASPTAFIASLAVGILLTLIFFVKGMGDMLNGREELGEKHASNVVLGTVLSAAAIIVLLFLIILLFVSSSIMFSMFTFATAESMVAFVLSLILILALSITFLVLIGLGLIFFIKEIIPQDKKMLMWVSFGMLIAFPFISIIVLSLGLVFCIPSAIVLILPIILLLLCYKQSHLRISQSGIKAVPLIPCPFCDKEIPTNATSCKHCGATFEKEKPDEIDPRLSIDLPEPKQLSPKGYTPVEGPTQSQKRLLLTIISVIVVIIVVAAGLFLIFQRSDTEDFTGSWKMDLDDELKSVLGNEIGAMKWVLYENGSMLFSFLDNDGYDIVSSRAWGEWGVKDDMFYTYNPANQAGPLYETEGAPYELSDNGNTLKLNVGIGTETYGAVFHRIS